MLMTSSFKFPTPVGGTPSSIDFIPSIVFAAAYGVVAICAFYRLLKKGQRTAVLVGNASFSTESIVMLTLRAAQARQVQQGGTISTFILTYFQVSYMLGYIGIASDFVKLFRCLLVIPTYGSDMYFQSPPAPSLRWPKPQTVQDDESECENPGWPKPPPGTPDMPLLRTNIRNWTGVLSLLYLFVALVPGIVAGATFKVTFTNEKFAMVVFRLRYISAAAVVPFTLLMACGAVWGYYNIPRVSKTGFRITLFVCLQVLIVAIYRLFVLHNTEDTLANTGSGSLNSDRDKILFYVFHLLPDWLACATLQMTNTREIFATGPFGDWRQVDETEKERAKREERDAKRAANAEA